MKNPRIKVFICTYNDDPVLHDNLDSIVKSDLLTYDYEVRILNNYGRMTLPDRYSSYNINVINNEARPDFSRGHLSRSWNQGILHGFRSLKEPIADIVVLLQNDVQVAKNWMSNLLKYHEKYSFILLGDGDALQSMTIESVKAVGLFDERFCNIAYHESDYQIRQMALNREKSSINDFGRGNLHNQLYPCKDEIEWDDKTDPKYEFYKGGEDILVWTPSGAQRETEHHLKSYAYHGLASSFIRRKWVSNDSRFLDLYNRDRLDDPVSLGKKLEAIKWRVKGYGEGWAPSFFEDAVGDPDGWFAEAVSKEAGLRCVDPQPILYPYFELDIPDLHTKGYRMYPTAMFRNQQQLNDEEIGKVHRAMLEDKTYWNYPPNIVMSSEENEVIKKGLRFADTKKSGTGGPTGQIIKTANNYVKSPKAGYALILGHNQAGLAEIAAQKYAGVHVVVGSQEAHRQASEALAGQNVSVACLNNLPLLKGIKSNAYSCVYITCDYLMSAPTHNMRNLMLLEANRVLALDGCLAGSYGHGQRKDHAEAVHFFEKTLKESAVWKTSDPVNVVNDLLYCGYSDVTMLSGIALSEDPYSAYMVFTGVKKWPQITSDASKKYSPSNKRLRTYAEILSQIYEDALGLKVQVKRSSS